MNRMKEHIQNAKNQEEIDKLRGPILEDVDNFLENQKLFKYQKNKIQRHGGQINE